MNLLDPIELTRSLASASSPKLVVLASGPITSVSKTGTSFGTYDVFFSTTFGSGFRDYSVERHTRDHFSGEFLLVAPYESLGAEALVDGGYVTSIGSYIDMEAISSFRSNLYSFATGGTKYCAKAVFGGRSISLSLSLEGAEYVIDKMHPGGKQVEVWLIHRPEA
jgi:hypothetical protein